MDVQTLVLANFIWMCCALAALLGFGRIYPEAPGVGGFTRCVLCLTLAAAVIGGVGPQGAVRHGVWLALGNGLLVLGFVFFNQGVAVYWRQPRLGWGWHAVLAVGATALYAAFTGTHNSLGARAVIVGTALGWELGLGARRLARVEAWPAAWALGAFAVFNLVRGPVTWREQTHPASERLVLLGTDIGFLLFGMGIALALVWMVINDLRLRLDHLARTDDLTGLLNRRALEERAGELLGRAKPQPLAMLLLDLDHFKQINDRCGHAAGDHALLAVALHLRQAAGGDAVVGRMGGEEFVVVLPGLDLARALDRADALRRGIAGLAVKFEGQALRLAASFGVAARLEGESWAAWLQRADRAQYRAKQAGRNCVRAAEASIAAAEGADGD